MTHHLRDILLSALIALLTVAGWSLVFAVYAEVEPVGVETRAGLGGTP